MNDNRPEVYRDHFNECLAHFSKNLLALYPKGSKQARQAKRPIASFCGVSVHTVTRWLYRDSPPIGEQLIRMMCYLDLVGYRVIELEKTPTILRQYLELIGFGILTGQEAKQILGYSNTSTLYHVLQGGQGISRYKRNQMFEEWRKRRAELENKKARARREIIPMTMDAGNRPRSIVKLMEGLLGLLEEEKLETADEQVFAELARSSGMVLRLSAHLNTLSSRLSSKSTQPDKGNSNG